tara:strand:- start:452 stop:829 length:378 start_codon:yes stop_codon:yes gene_type:complete
VADKKFNIKDQLAGIAALIAAIVAIGGGFVKYGEITTKLDNLEAASKTVDKVSIEMVTSNEKDIEFLKQEVETLKNKKETIVDLSDIEASLANNKTKSLVNAKEIELLKVQIEEIKVSTSNPLTN